MIHKFTEEFELIQDDRIREFAVEGFRIYEENDSSGFIPYLKSIVQYLNELCEVIDAEDLTKDMIITAGLLHAIDYNPMLIRPALYGNMPKVGRDTFNHILYLIERQQGFKSLYPEYQPQIDSPIHVWLLPMAIELAKRG